MVNINTEMSANIDDTMVLLFYDRYIFLVFYKFMDRTRVENHQKKVSKHISTLLENLELCPKIQFSCLL